MPGKQRLDMGGIGFKLQVLYQIPDRSGFLTVRHRRDITPILVDQSQQRLGCLYLTGVERTQVKLQLGGKTTEYIIALPVKTGQLSRITAAAFRNKGCVVIRQTRRKCITQTLQGFFHRLFLLKKSQYVRKDLKCLQVPQHFQIGRFNHNNLLFN